MPCRISSYLAPIARLSVQAFKVDHSCNLRVNRFEAGKQCDERRILRRVDFGGAVAFGFDFRDLAQQQLDHFDFTQQLGVQTWQQRPTIAGSQRIEPPAPTFCSGS